MRIASYRSAILLCVTALASACAGGGNEPAPRHLTSTVRTGLLAISFKDASATFAGRAGSRRSRQLDIETALVSIAVNGAAPVQFKTGACSANATGTALVCPAQDVVAPAGDDTIVVTTTDEMGRALEDGTFSVSVVAGSTTPLAISLGGQVANVILVLSDNAPPVGSVSRVVLTSKSTDVDGYYIVGPYANPIAVTSSDSNAEAPLSKAVVSSSADAITVTFGGGASAVTFTGTVTNPSAAGTATLDPGAAFTELALPSDSKDSCSMEIFDVNGASGFLEPGNVGCNDAAVAPNGQIVTDFYAGGLELYAGYVPQAQMIGSVYPNRGRLKFDAAGNLYVDDFSYIDVFAPPIFSSAYPAYTIVPPTSAQSNILIMDAGQNVWLVGNTALNEISNSGGPAGILKSIAYGSAVPAGASFGPNGELWICTTSGDANVLERFAPGATDLTTPTATISGAGVAGCAAGLHVDRAGNAYVLVSSRDRYGQKHQSVNVFPENADGAASPSKSFTGPVSVFGASDFGLQNAL